MIRNPAVAGQFYQNDEKKLRKQIQNFLSKAKHYGKNPIAGISPHAGYSYSGAAAAFTFKALERTSPENVIIIGPNHTGFGEAVSIDTHTEWKTPLGQTKVNNELCEKISCREFALNSEAHESEHSIEVQLPFLQMIYTDFEIVPICVADQSENLMKTLGEKISENIGKKDIVIASTDFSHYVPYDKAYENDLKAIKHVEKLDTRGFYKAIKENSVSACGFGAVAAAIEFSKQRGAKKAELLKYTTSGDVTGEKDAVVGYASMILE